MSKKIFKNTIVSLGLGHAVMFCHGALHAVASPLEANAPKVGSPAEDSFRLSLVLGSPRRYATRFDKATRTLQIRVTPSRAAEFEDARAFDTRYVRRVVVEEKSGGVVLSLQLRNMPLGWLVTTMDSPWRLIVDVWRSGPVRKETLEEQWDWQEQSSGRPGTSTSTIGSERSTASSNGDAVDVPAVEEIGAKSVPLILPPPSEGSSVTGADSSAVGESLAAGRGAPPDAGFPENFGPLERRGAPARDRLSSLQREAGAAIGSSAEFDKLKALADELHRIGDDEAAVGAYRKLAVLSERRFLELDANLWRAGESAYLARNFDAADDYLRGLVMRHPSSPLASQAKLRLVDMDVITNETVADKSRPLQRQVDEYARIALSESSTDLAKIAASVRLVAGKIESDRDAANPYRRSFDTCVTSDRVPIEMQKSCAYILTRAALENSDVLSADDAVQKFKNSFPRDPRVNALENKVQETVRAFLQDSLRARTWDAWVAFERKTRPALLEFTLGDPELTFARADAFDTVGDAPRALQLYNLYWQGAPDSARRDEAAARGAALAARARDTRRVATNLARLQGSATRKSNGLNDKSVAAVRTLALPPNGNARALSLLLDEMRFGRYVERELEALLRFASMLRRSPSADTVIDKILQAPLKGAEETRQVEEALLRHADDLRDSGRLQKSADIYLAASNLAQASKRAEAAYKAGLAYARSGQLEKAKAAWQAAAADMNDKRFSSLANERLERLR